MEDKGKYPIDKLKRYPEHTWAALVGIMIANELAEFNATLKKLVPKK